MFKSEFSHHAGRSGEGCCLFTLLMLFGAVSVAIGAVVLAVSS